MGLRLALALAVAAQLGCAAAGAQTVTLQGMLGDRALLIVDGKPPKGVVPGDAQRFRVDWKAGHAGSAQTAHGVMPAWRVELAAVRIGDVEAFDVDALVSQQPIPTILLGNSFLDRFQMKRDHEQMVLERRY